MRKALVLEGPSVSGVWLRHGPRTDASLPHPLRGAKTPEGPMGSENFNRQFILLDFRDLDNPEFLGFVRAPEFSTYLLMRRHIWRSPQPHYMGLHELYAHERLLT